MSSTNQAWALENFLDSLILELDRAQDTLAVKGVTRPLTYTVKDVSLDLQAFPNYDGEKVRFTTAQPGEEGSSRLTIELGSITDRVIREVTRGPISADDVSLEEVETLDENTKRKLEKIGVHSASDLERVAARKVDLKAATGSEVDYSDLANAIKKSRRRRASPQIDDVSWSRGDTTSRLGIDGKNLAMAQSADEFPMAVLNGETVVVASADASSVVLSVPTDLLHDGPNRLELALDQYAVVTLEVRK
jgi:hypothetical protein